jgi:glycosyltransferase involved in cell wall biosynthesis
VVCSDRTALPEVAGEAALYCNPDEAESIEAAVRRVDGDEALAGRLRAGARERAAEFRWESAAKRVVEVYTQVVGLPRYGEG